MSDGLATAKQLITETMIDLVEDALFVDRPLLPSARRRVEQANEELVRTLRIAALDDDTLLDPAKVQAICNLVARRHDVKLRHMFGPQHLSEELSLDLATGQEVEERTVHGALFDRTDADRQDTMRAGPVTWFTDVVRERRAPPAVREVTTGHQLAFACLVTALMAIVLLVADLTGPDSRWPAVLALPALAALLVVVARVTLGASLDQRLVRDADAA